MIDLTWAMTAALVVCERRYERAMQQFSKAELELLDEMIASARETLKLTDRVRDAYGTKESSNGQN